MCRPHCVTKASTSGRKKPTSDFRGIISDLRHVSNRVNNFGTKMSKIQISGLPVGLLDRMFYQLKIYLFFILGKKNKSVNLAKFVKILKIFIRNL